MMRLKWQTWTVRATNTTNSIREGKSTRTYNLENIDSERLAYELADAFQKHYDSVAIEQHTTYSEEFLTRVFIFPDAGCC